jgi:signal transduction histidine kinase
MQPQASRARIIIRTSLAPELGEVIADERALRQILLNLLSHAIKLTGPGGQAIVSTARSQTGEAVLRVRDTGIGMSAQELQAALQSFQQTTASANLTSAGPSLGLRLSKALTEANRAQFAIESAPNAGTLVEIVFPADPSAGK